MSQLVYEAAVYSTTVKYTNFKGDTNETQLYFALDPIQLLEIIASVPTNRTKSKNPARQNDDQPISDEQQIRLVRNLAAKAAGFPSDDGESWEPFEDFANTIAGKAFITRMVSSDGMRKEFAEKVFLDPFRAYVGFAEAEPSNTPKEVQQMRNMLSQLEATFAEKPDPEESLEDRRLRLQREIDAMNQAEAES